MTLIEWAFTYLYTQQQLGERMLHLEDHLLHHVLGDEDRRKVSGSGMIIFVCTIVHLLQAHAFVITRRKSQISSECYRYF